MTLQNNKYKFAKKLESEDEYRKLADDLLAFALKESSLDINEFPLGLMINPKDFAAFVEHSPYFADAYDTALRMIGARIKRCMYQGTIDRQCALEMLPLYDPEYRQYLHEKKQNDAVPAGQTKFIVVEIPEAPRTDEVAEQKARKEVARASIGQIDPAYKKKRSCEVE